ncbi:6069_t:CDS:2 [Funneliformis geosporum]|uniref:6069_t:CDS:1 n=1 Tax=Funneliformis geosporum TaxID=1117311 RepID=A0A9W4T718_9GLOM|nr:6069_t:CDS:2 [Funneliformis geosporum]
MVRECTKKVGKGIIYVDVPPVVNKFVEDFANAIGYSFDKHYDFIELFRRKFLGTKKSDVFERGAKNYKAKNGGKQPVLILDNISKIGQEDVNLLKDLDLIDEEVFTYIHKKLYIEEKVTNQLIKLLDGWINKLKDYGNKINEGYNFEVERAFTI